MHVSLPLVITQNETLSQNVGDWPVVALQALFAYDGAEALARATVDHRATFHEVIGHDPIPLPDVQTDLAPSRGVSVSATNEEEAA